MFDPTDGRLRGRAGVDQRLTRLRAEPLCRHCLTKGITRPSTVPDHIDPLAFGGADDESNIQCLCDACHKLKSEAEDASRRGAANHPTWLEPSAIPLTILCGPPCSGKTTYIAERASPGDVVIDIDTIAAGISPGYVHWTGALTSEILNQAIRARNAMLGSLKRRTEGKAWFIVAAPTHDERMWWRDKLLGKVVLLHPGSAECKRRAIQRGTPKAIAGVDAWERKALEPWAPPKPARPSKVAVGADGWPVTG